MPGSSEKGLFDVYYGMVVKSDNLDDPLFDQLKSFGKFTAMTYGNQKAKQLTFIETPLGETEGWKKCCNVVCCS